MRSLTLKPCKQGPRWLHTRCLEPKSLPPTRLSLAAGWLDRFKEGLLERLAQVRLTGVALIRLPKLLAAAAATNHSTLFAGRSALVATNVFGLVECELSQQSLVLSMWSDVGHFTAKALFESLNRP